MSEFGSVLSGAREPDPPAEFLSREQCQALFRRIETLGTGGGETTVSLVSRWTGSVRWARNRIALALDTRTTNLTVSRYVRGQYGSSSTTRLDDDGLRRAVRDAETTMLVFAAQDPELLPVKFVDEAILHPTLWSDSTYHFDADHRAALAEELAGAAESAGMIGAGTFNVIADGSATISSAGLARYYPTTAVECSITVRDPKATGAGWAGVNHYDIGRIDPRALSARAIDKAIKSVNPRAVEPGRFTAILEPQAVADLYEPALMFLERVIAEAPSGPFGGSEPGRSKINLRVLDPRLMLRADPMDPDGGFLPFNVDDGTPYQAVTWIDQGILRELAYGKQYALVALGRDRALLNPYSFKLMPAPGVPTATIDEMIAKTERGILVTRFDRVMPRDFTSMTCDGYTRNGLWLIEHGKLSYPIKNFRFLESPILMLNRLLDVSLSQRVFAPGHAYLAPAVRVEDFDFVSLADGV